MIKNFFSHYCAQLRSTVQLKSMSSFSFCNSRMCIWSPTEIRTKERGKGQNKASAEGSFAARNETVVHLEITKPVWRPFLARSKESYWIVECTGERIVNRTDGSSLSQMSAFAARVTDHSWQRWWIRETACFVYRRQGGHRVTLAKRSCTPERISIRLFNEHL